MSPRRAHTPLLGYAIAFVVLVVSSCIFNPTEKPPPVQQGPGIPKSPDGLIQALQFAYQTRNYTAFENLFPTTADNASYLFIGVDETGNPFNWDATEELRIHRRMFNPENPLPGETPVSSDLWLQSVTINLTPINSFTERPDLYKSPGNPEGLDSNVWKAQESQYSADLLFDLMGPNDYRVNGKANFVVIENKLKASGEDRKFLIYRWEDLGTGKPTTAAPPAL